MKKIKISRSTYDSSQFRRLPQDLVLQILSKVMDLKTLCLCKLVSRRFYWIVHRVDAISFTVPPVQSPYFDWNTSDAGFTKWLIWLFLNGVVIKPVDLLRRMVVPSSKPFDPLFAPIGSDYFKSAMTSLWRFRTLKSLHIQLPFSAPKGTDNRSLFKWKFNFGNRIESYLFLWPSSIRDENGLYVNGNGDEEENLDMALHIKKIGIGFKCMLDMSVRRRMLLGCILDFPLLENVSFTDSGKRGKVSLHGEKLAELRKWMLSPSETETIEQKLNRIRMPRRVHECNLPLLELPVSGYVMKGISFLVLERDVVGNESDGFLNSDEIAVEWDDCADENDGFEDKKEAAYNEAVVEILTKYKGLMERM